MERILVLVLAIALTATGVIYVTNAVASAMDNTANMIANSHER